MELPEMIPVSSSSIARIGYKAEQEELYVEFNNSSIYVYSNVTETIWENFQSAPSIGSFHYQVIRDKYPYERI